MKTVQKLALLMSMVWLLTAIPAMAQVDNGVTFQAPFAFYAGNAKLPAGSYKVTQPDDNSELLLIESTDGAHSVFVDYSADDSGATPAKTEVTFNKYGSTEFLNRISIEGQNSLQILASKAEQHAAKVATSEKHSLTAKNGR